MSGSVVVREHLELNERSPRPRPRWWAWLGILSSAALFGAFCIWVYTAVRTNDGARCQQTAAAADADTMPRMISNLTALRRRTTVAYASFGGIWSRADLADCSRSRA